MPDITNAMAYSSPVLYQVDAQNTCDASGRAEQPRTKPQQCGFASAVGSAQQDGLSALDRDVYPGQGREPAEHDDSVTNLDRGYIRHV